MNAYVPSYKIASSGRFLAYKKKMKGYATVCRLPSGKADKHNFV